MNKHSAKGFTLIEILIVVSIIGVLSSLTLLGLGSFRASGRDVKRVTDLRQITNALELYYAKTGNYPATLENLVPSVIAKLPVDPISPTTDYKYGKCGDSGYAVQATLEEYNKKILNEGAPANSCGLPCDAATKNEYCIKF